MLSYSWWSICIISCYKAPYTTISSQYWKNELAVEAHNHTQKHTKKKKKTTEQEKPAFIEDGKIYFPPHFNTYFKIHPKYNISASNPLLETTINMHNIYKKLKSVYILWSTVSYHCYQTACSLVKVFVHLLEYSKWPVVKKVTKSADLVQKENLKRPL